MPYNVIAQTNGLPGRFAFQTLPIFTTFACGQSAFHVSGLTSSAVRLSNGSSTWKAFCIMAHEPCKGCGKPYKEWKRKRVSYIENIGRWPKKKYKYVTVCDEYCSKKCRQKYYSDNSLREPFTPRLKKFIFERDSNQCRYCGEKRGDTDRFSIDHILPVTHGGTNDPANLVACCQTCNSIASNKVFKSFADKQAWILGKQKMQKPKGPKVDWRAWVYGGMKSLKKRQKL